VLANEGDRQTREHTNIKRCPYLAQLCILSFHRFEVGTMSPLRAYTHTHIKIETDKSLTKLRQITHVTSMCVYTH
jgi:hypothetical protein